METVLEEIKRFFPQYLVTQHALSSLPSTNLIVIFAEEGKKWNLDGSPNPKWWWHEWVIQVDEDETKIDRAYLAQTLEDIGKTINRQVEGSINGTRA